jgi:hypothetical protein
MLARSRLMIGVLVRLKVMIKLAGLFVFCLAPLARACARLNRRHRSLTANEYFMGWERQG